MLNAVALVGTLVSIVYVNSCSSSVNCSLSLPFTAFLISGVDGGGVTVTVLDFFSGSLLILYAASLGTLIIPLTT